MRHVKTLRSFLIALPLVTLAASGCAVDAQSDSEAIASSEEALASRASGFVWASIELGSYNAPSSYSYNSAGGTNRISRIGNGQYRVDFPGLGNAVGGNVQVTAFAVGSERCKVASWRSSGSTLQAFVNCFTTTGVPVNTLFTASYLRRAGKSGVDGAYVWANEPSAAYYAPDASRRWNSTGGGVSITHTPGTGRYLVAFAGQTLVGGTVEVTAYGSTNSYCKVVSWGPSGANQNIDVACFNGTTGQPTESQFTLMYARASTNDTRSFSYAWANQPSTPSYTPHSAYQTASLDPGACPPVSLPLSVVERSGVGQYTVWFPGMATGNQYPSHVKVTGYGSGSDTCKVTGYGPNTNDGFATVACYSAGGAPVDAYFTIAYSSQAGNPC